MKVIFTIGAPGSGKTTFAREMCKKDGNWAMVSRDDIRFMITGASGWKDYKYNKKTERVVTELQEAIIRTLLTAGRNVIVHDTNLNPTTLSRLESFCVSLGATTEKAGFDVPLTELWRRDQFRGDRAVGREVVYKMYKKFQEQHGGFQKYTPNLGLPDAYIFDIDGTLAEMNDRSPYDWDKVGTDAPRPAVLHTLRALEAHGFRIVVLSGRDAVCRQETLVWLENHNIFPDELHMRPKGDFRKDTEVKAELFWNNVAPHYNVLGVFDDRPSVCRLWMEMGLQVFNVGNPWEEF